MKKEHVPPTNLKEYSTMLGSHSKGYCTRCAKGIGYTNGPTLCLPCFNQLNLNFKLFENELREKYETEFPGAKRFRENQEARRRDGIARK